MNDAKYIEVDKEYSEAWNKNDEKEINRLSPIIREERDIRRNKVLLKI